MHLVLFLFGDGIQWGAVEIVFAVFYFSEVDVVAFGADEVDFVEFGFVVLCDYFVALLF